MDSATTPCPELQMKKVMEIRKYSENRLKELKKQVEHGAEELQGEDP